jgi:DNA-binding NarL/FixJ family response regulator
MGKNDFSFTKRELQILQLIAEGNKTGEIGEKFFISHRTVQTHKTHVLKKTDLKSTCELTCFAVSNKDKIKSLLETMNKE